MVLTLKTCCCCVNLRTGCLIIGYLGMFSNIASLIYIMVESRHLVTQDNVVLQTMAETDTIAIIEDDCQITLPVFTIAMAIIIINLIFIILLLVGLHKHKRRYLMAYLIYALIGIVIMIILFIWSIVERAPIIAVISCLITVLVAFYFVLVIRSYYLKMGTHQRPPIA